MDFYHIKELENDKVEEFLSKKYKMSEISWLASDEDEPDVVSYELKEIIDDENK